MSILIAIVLLVFLFAYLGRKSKPTQSTYVTMQRKETDTDWIDELEILDAIIDDFI